MGFIDAIDKIDKVITIAKPIIESVSSKIQPEMKQFAERLFELSEKYPSIKDFAMVVDKSADILGDILFVLGVKSEQADIIGLKIAQADKGLLDFESVEDYLNYLKNDVHLDENEYNAMSEVEKMAYTVVGMAVEVGAIGEKLGIKLDADFVLLISKVVNAGIAAIDATGIVDILKMVKENGTISVSDIYEYFMGEGESDRINTGKILKDILATLYPGKADDIIMEIKDEARN